MKINENHQKTIKFMKINQINKINKITENQY